MQKKETEQGSKVLDTGKKLFSLRRLFFFQRQVCNSGSPHSRASVDFRGLETWDDINNFVGQQSHSRAQQAY